MRESLKSLPINNVVIGERYFHENHYNYVFHDIHVTLNTNINLHNTEKTFKCNLYSQMVFKSFRKKRMYNRYTFKRFANVFLLC
jgi:hypothetical protein